MALLYGDLYRLRAEVKELDDILKNWADGIAEERYGRLLMEHDKLMMIIPVQEILDRISVLRHLLITINSRLS